MTIISIGMQTYNYVDIIWCSLVIMQMCYVYMYNYFLWKVDWCLHMDCALLMSGINLSIPKIILWWTKKNYRYFGFEKTDYYKNNVEKLSSKK